MNDRRTTRWHSNTCFLSPGVGIGIWMTYYDASDDPGETLATLVMQGLACGTILYVAFFEILERERSKSTVGLIQWTLLLTGFLAVMALQVFGTLALRLIPKRLKLNINIYYSR